MSAKKSRLLRLCDEYLGGAANYHGKWEQFAKTKSAELQKLGISSGISSKIGYIFHAGRVEDGTFQVQFNEGSDGWSSRWPAWAFETAFAALLHGKKVWVIYEGEVPYGKHLLHVLVLPYVS